MLAQALDHLFYGATPGDLVCFAGLAIGFMFAVDRLVASLRNG